MQLGMIGRGRMGANMVHRLLAAGHQCVVRNPQHYQDDFNLPDIAEVWRRGSVVASWLLDLSAAALIEDPELRGFQGRVSDSGEGRWTIKAAIDEAVLEKPSASTGLSR
jgi:6-phosphogluconate dehydrogenase